MEFYQYIGGELVKGEGTVRSVYAPGTGEEIVKLAGASAAQTQAALDSAEKAFPVWSKMSITERGQWIEKLRAALLAHKDELVDILAQETGKLPFAAGRGFNVLYDALAFYQEEAVRVYGRATPDYNSNYGSYHITYQYPVGVVVSHLAWNMPLLNLGAKLGPALASGCTCVIKPASFTPLSALRVGELAKEIGFPAGVFNIVSGTVAEVGNVLNSSPIPKMITLIGSTNTGMEVIRSSATSIKAHSLELGGNAPAIVMADADVEAAANWVANMKMNNCGQLCTSVNRALVHRSVADKFCAIIEEKFRNCRIGWSGGDFDLGPLISDGDRSRVLGLVDSAVAEGATLVCGGKAVEGESGYFMTPALLTNCNNQMTVCRTEIFGPVLPVIVFDTEDEALQIANDTEYGLTSYVFTNDLKTSMRMYKELETGEVFINIWGGGSPIHYPHSGMKKSGIGADFSTVSLMEYYHCRRVCITP